MCARQRASQNVVFSMCVWDESKAYRNVLSSRKSGEKDARDIFLINRDCLAFVAEDLTSNKGSYRSRFETYEKKCL